MRVGKIKTYILYWKTGETEEIIGENISLALAMAGYGGSALAALDYWEEKEED